MKVILISILFAIGLSSCASIKDKTNNIKLQKSCTDVTEEKTLADMFCKK
jgi:hypothetical protein